MSTNNEVLPDKFAEFLRWERRKRREQICVIVACAALGATLILLPLQAQVLTGLLRWLVPLAFFIVLAPCWFYLRRWRKGDETRTLTAIDKTLRLEERAITAWDLIARKEIAGAAQLVLRQAEDKLRGADPRTLFPRRGDWPTYMLLPLMALWFGLLWFDVDRRGFEASRSPAPLAQTVREFSRQMADKAKSEGLRQSLKMAEELAKIAEHNLRGKSDDEQLKKELAGATKKLDALGNSPVDKANFAIAESEQSLKDLRAELEAVQDLFNLPETSKSTQDLAQQWLDRLASLPQLNRQLGREPQKGQGLGEDGLKEFLKRMDQQVTGELDRRALLDAQQFLEQMMQMGRKNQGEQNMRAAGPDGQDERDSGEKSQSTNNRPGKEAGQKDGSLQSLPPFQGGAAAQVKGQLGAGESSGIAFKGKPVPGKSELSQQAIVASYRRQAEQELNSERVPESLKETIKNYFLALGTGEEKNR